MNSSASLEEQDQEGSEKKCLNSELWHACAGPLVCLPTIGTRVVYFPQGHSEQVAASTNKEVEGHIPNYPNLPPQLMCQLHNVTMHADVETDEVYAQMTLQPLNAQEQKDTYVPIEMGIPSKQPTNYFCKTLTASDTSTHGGFSVPRRAAEKVFPPLDFSQQPPAQELVARDIHDVEWKFRHIFRGQPKRHLLTTGWSVFVSAKKLVAGDSVIFIWNENNQLFLGIRRASRPQTVMPSSVLSSDSMHIGLLAAAAHAATTNSRFTIFYNPRACPSEFVIPLSRYVKAVCHTRISVGVRFRMLFETEESSVRRYMGTVTGIGDLDPVRWPNSQWRSVKVGWDESTAGDRQPRVSLWEIEPLTTFPMYPSLFPLRLKRPWHSGLPFHHENMEAENNSLMWMRGDDRDRPLHPLHYQSLTMDPYIQQQMLSAAALQDMRGGNDFLKQQLLQYQQPFQFPQQSSLPTHPMQSFLNQTSPQQVISENRNPHTFQFHGDYLQQNKPMVPSQLCQNLLFNDSGTNFSSLPNVMNMSRVGQTMSEPSQQPWEPKLTMNRTGTFGSTNLLQSFSEKNGCVGVDNCNTGSHNQQNVFGLNVDSSSSMLSNAVPSIAGNVFDSNVNDGQYESSCIQNSLYGYLDPALDLVPNGDEIDQTTKTFVKVYKTGSVGRSLDISRFSSYEELREELSQMFNIEGLLEDPLRSGWQLVFVDRENDVLLLGDDPWEAFMNNVWYIKILSPEDLQRMGKTGVDSFS